MSASVVPYGTKWGTLPGSVEAGSAIYGPQYTGVHSMMAPPTPASMDQQQATMLGNALFRDPWRQNELWDQQDADRNRKNKVFDDLIGQLGSNNGNYNFKAWGSPIPPPTWASTAGVWSQDQINNQANAQRAQLFAQAANQQRGYTTKAAASGFSPMSPLTQFMGQVANQRAGANAAANETNLNWTAAQGNREASQRGESINAGLYGSWANALGQQQNMRFQAQTNAMNQRLQQQQLLASLVGRM